MILRDVRNGQHSLQISRMDRRDRIKTVVERFTKREVGFAESLFESGLLDSFSLPDMVTALEKEFGLRIPDSDLNPRTFDAIDRMDTYLAGKL
jgi:acyl carrier protein